MINLLFVIVLSYLVGSIPTSIIVTKLVKGVDIRDHGSGNAGGTNTIRVLGWKYGLGVILFDALKGAVAVIFVARLFYGDFPVANHTPFDDFTLVQILAGISAVLGHIWTIFAGFKGGKGIATALGFMLVLVTTDMLLALVVFGIVVYATRYVSLGSISAAVSLPIIIFVRENIFGVNIPGYGTILPFVVVIASLLIFKHKKNIVRILNGEESRISFNKKEK
jgi:glycerol-3-phosphate acyltransferase PlsY